MKTKSLIIITLIGVILSLGSMSFAEEKEELTGMKVWDRNCGRCHHYRAINERTDKEWRVIVTHMRVRANLSGEEARKVLEYLQEHN